MKADNIILTEFISSGKRAFCIPVYQRNYDWKKNECITLFRDIEKIAVSDTRSTHFLGTIVYVFGENTNANYNEFIIIDGQQRLTSIMLLLKAIMDSTESQELKDEILEDYLTNKRGPERYRIKLKPMKSDSDAYRQLLDNSYDEDNPSKIIQNYRLFMDLILSSSLSIEQIYQGILKLEIVYIQLTANSENPQLIFESLNSTGMDLTQADLIRNFLLMGESYDRQEELYRKYWLILENTLPDTYISDFIRDYLTLKNNSISKKDAVYQAFKDYYLDKTDHNIENFFIELISYAKYYGWFKYCNSSNNDINNRLSQIQQLKSTVVYPFLLYVFEECYSVQRISEEDLCDILDIIISFVIRRLICEFPTNALNKLFAALPRELSEKNSINLTDNLAAALMQKTGKSVFPRDNLVIDKLQTRDFYNFKHSKFVLSQIENSMSKEQILLEDVTIEHVMPQTLSDKWKVDLGKRYLDIHEKYLHRIGNLTLTGYNSELSNSSYDVKRKVYHNSNIKMTRAISEYDHWSAEEIEERTLMLSKQITEIWALPYTDSTLSAEEYRTVYDIMDNVDVTGRTIKEVVIMDEIFKVSTWKSFFITVCKQMNDYDSAIFESLTKHNDFQGKSRRIITNNSNNLRNPEKIAEDVYIETNLSANDILNYTKLVVSKFDGMESEISYTLSDKAIDEIKSGSVNTDSNIYVNYLTECFDKKVEKQKNNYYCTTDYQIGILATVSNTYKGSRRNRFWFGIRGVAIEKLERYKDSYIAFTCGEVNNTVIMPVSFFKNISDKLNYSVDTNGKVSHWHVVIYQTPDRENTSIVLSKPKVTERDISKLLYK